MFIGTMSHFRRATLFRGVRIIHEKGCGLHRNWKLLEKSLQDKLDLKLDKMWWKIEIKLSGNMTPFISVHN